MGTLDRAETLLREDLETNNRATGFLVEEERKQLVSPEKFYMDSGKDIDKRRVIIIGKTPVKVEPDISRRALQGGQPEETQRGGHQMARQPVKIKAMEPPKWDGKYRTFTRFKLLWD